MDFYTKIDGIDKKVSRIFMGTAYVPKNVDTDEWLSSIYETGVNTIDTARKYPGSEKTIGKWLDKTGKRDELVILSKCCHPEGSIG